MVKLGMFYIPADSYEIKQTKKKGRGVFATKIIPKGTIIGEYKGSVMPYEQVQNEDYDFLMYLDDVNGVVADRNEVGVHLMNHSCDPNCTMDIPDNPLIFIAIKDIQPNEELTINYRYPSKDGCQNCTHNCFCESPNCKGTIHND